MLFPAITRAVILHDPLDIPSKPPEGNLPDFGDACVNGFLNRLQLVDLAHPSPPTNPIVGELWVDTSKQVQGVGDPVLKLWSGTQWLLSTLSGSTFGFLNLNDTPNEYADSGGAQFVRVNSASNGVEFAGISFTELADTPKSYTGKGLHFIRVNATEDGLELANGTGLLVEWDNILFAGSSVLDIEDMPLTYQNQNGKFLAVNDTEDGLEFRDATQLNQFSKFTALTDTPNSLATQAGNYLRVNAAETSFDFVRPGQILAAATPIARMDWFAIDIPTTTKLYTDPRSGMVYYNPVGWSIGSTSANADIRRSDWLPFYAAMWAQPYTTVIGGKAQTAAQDYANNRALQIPNLSGRHLLNRQTTAFPFGAIGGAAQVTLDTAHMPAHSHGARSTPHNHGVSQRPHTHSFHQVDLNSDFGQPYPAQAHRNGPGNRITGGAMADITIRSATTDVVIDSTGEGQAHDNMAPYFSATLLIFTGIA